VIFQAAAEQSSSWWSVLISSGLGAAILGLIVKLLRVKWDAITKEKAATALRVAIDGFARELASTGRPSVAKELTRRIDSKMAEAGDAAAAHNDAAVKEMGTVETVMRALRDLNA
jgi:hypothetical protein